MDYSSLNKHCLHCKYDDSGAELVEWVIVISIIAGAAIILFALVSDSLGNLISDLVNSV